MEPKLMCTGGSCSPRREAAEKWVVKADRSKLWGMCAQCADHCHGVVDGYDVQPVEKPQDVKDTNPKDACGVAKTPMMSVVPQNVMAEVAVGLMEGARKYGRHNYRDSGVRASVYADATTRHLAAWWEGEDLDPDSGISHISKAIASLIVLRDCAMRGNLTDDRPPQYLGFMPTQNANAGYVIDKYPTSKPPHTQKENP